MKMVLYCSLYPISSEFEAADEIIAKAQHHFGEKLRWILRLEIHLRKSYILKNLC